MRNLLYVLTYIREVNSLAILKELTSFSIFKLSIFLYFAGSSYSYLNINSRRGRSRIRPPRWYPSLFYLLSLFWRRSNLFLVGTFPFFLCLSFSCSFWSPLVIFLFGAMCRYSAHKVSIFYLKDHLSSCKDVC